MILAGIVTGLASAVGGGLANVTITLASRRVGVMLTYLGAQLAAFATILLLALIAGVAIPLDSGLPAATLAVAFISTITYLSFFGALLRGPVSVVSPVVGAYGGVAVVLALVLLGESISRGQGLAIIAAVAGVILASVTLDRQAMRVQLRGPGPALAVAAAIGFGANVTAMTIVVRDFGWLETLVVWRFWMSIIALVIFIVWLARRRSRREGSRASEFVGIDRNVVGLILLAGVFDTLATASIAIGLEISFAWLVGLLSSLGPMSGAVWGLILFGERLTRVQAAGIGLVALSLFVLAFA